MAKPSSEDNLRSEARSGLAKFKSSGAHVLDPYISTSAPRGAAPGAAPGAAGPTSQSQSAPYRSALWTGHVPADNVGFRLLKKAGWREGAGLGAGEQGRVEPVQAHVPHGQRGIGFDSGAAREQQAKRAREQAAAGPGAAAEAAQAEAAAEARARGRARRDLVARLVGQELGAEELDVKVKRHKQVMRAEADEARGRAIASYLRRAFNDPFDADHSADANPLGRPHALSDSNPLLDSWD